MFFQYVVINGGGDRKHSRRKRILDTRSCNSNSVNKLEGETLQFNLSILTGQREMLSTLKISARKGAVA